MHKGYYIIYICFHSVRGNELMTTYQLWVYTRREEEEKRGAFLHNNLRGRLLLSCYGNEKSTLNKSTRRLVIYKNIDETKFRACRWIGWCWIERKTSTSSRLRRSFGSFAWASSGCLWWCEANDCRRRRRRHHPCNTLSAGNVHPLRWASLRPHRRRLQRRRSNCRRGAAVKLFV